MVLLLVGGCGAVGRGNTAIDVAWVRVSGSLG